MLVGAASSALLSVFFCVQRTHTANKKISLIFPQQHLVGTTKTMWFHTSEVLQTAFWHARTSDPPSDKCPWGQDYYSVLWWPCHLLPYCLLLWAGCRMDLDPCEGSVSQMSGPLPFLLYRTFSSSFTRLEACLKFLPVRREFKKFPSGSGFLSTTKTVSSVANVDTNKAELNWTNPPRSAAGWEMSTSNTDGAPRSKTHSKKREKTAAMATRPSHCALSTPSRCRCESSLHNYSVSHFSSSPSSLSEMLEESASRCFECGW